MGFIFIFNSTRDSGVPDLIRYRQDLKLEVTFFERHNSRG